MRLRATKGASLHKTALKHMFSPNRVQVQHVLRAYCFENELFSVVFAHDSLERITIHTSPVERINPEHLNYF